MKLLMIILSGYLAGALLLGCSSYGDHHGYGFRYDNDKYQLTRAQVAAYEHAREKKVIQGLGGALFKEN